MGPLSFYETVEMLHFPQTWPISFAELKSSSANFLLCPLLRLPLHQENSRQTLILHVGLCDIDYNHEIFSYFLLGFKKAIPSITLSHE